MLNISVNNKIVIEALRRRNRYHICVAILAHYMQPMLNVSVNKKIAIEALRRRNRYHICVAVLAHYMQTYVKRFCEQQNCH